MRRVIAAAFMILLLAGCTTTAQEIKRPGGMRDYLITCGAAAGLKDCYGKANQVCPGGYDTVSEDEGIWTNELRIACPSGKKPAE